MVYWSKIFITNDGDYPITNLDIEIVRSVGDNFPLQPDKLYKYNAKLLESGNTVQTLDNYSHSNKRREYFDIIFKSEYHEWREKYIILKKDEEWKELLFFVAGFNKVYQVYINDDLKEILPPVVVKIFEIQQELYKKQAEK